MNHPQHPVSQPPSLAAPQRQSRLSRWSRLLLVVYWPLLALATHWPNGIISFDPATQDAYHLDKFLHLLAFGTLTLLLIHALCAPGSRPQRRHIALGGVLAAGYGLIDEWTQGSVAGRDYSYGDMLANVASALIIMAGLTRGSLADFYGRHRLAVLRGLLLVTLALMVYPAFTPHFQWTRFNAHRVVQALGWPRGRMFPYPETAHLLSAMLLTWMVPAARLLGGRRPRVEAALWVAVVAASSLAIEYMQVRIGRSRAMEWDDVVWHEVGVAAALVIWVLVAAMRVSSPRQGATAKPGGGAFVGHAMTVSVLTLISRFTGVVRDSVLGAVFGLTGVMGAFTIGFMVPNLFRRLFGEGALTAAFIPVYAEQLKKDPVMARRLASLCIGVLLLVTAALTLIGMGALDGLSEMRDWSPSARMAISLSRIMLPFMPMVCLVALLGGILQVHGRFGPSAAAPIIVNLGMIIAALLATAGIRGALSPQRAQSAITIVSYSVLIAGAVQVLWQTAAVLRVESFTVRCAQAWTAMKPVVVVMVPMVIGLAVFQINAFFDTLIAFGLAPPENGPDTFNLLGWSIPYPISGRGDTAALAFAQRLYQFPLGVFGIAVATAIFPALAHAVAHRRGGDEPDQGEFRTILQHGLRLTMFLGLPAGVGLILIRLPLTRAIFEYNRFDLDASRRVASILAGYAAAIWAYSMTHVITRAFYALKDARTPLRISVSMVMLNVALNMTLIWFLGAAGLAWSTSTAAAVQTFILLRAVRRYVARPVDRQVWRSWAKTAALTAAMSAVLAPILWWYDPATLSRMESFALLASTVALGAIVFVVGAWLIKADELFWLIRGDSHHAGQHRDLK